MEQKEKMIELIGTSDVSFECFPIGDHKEEHEALADHLLANGVVVLPCRCCECEYHDHDGGTGYCNYWRRWSNMSDYCNHGKRKGGDE